MIQEHIYLVKLHTNCLKILIHTNYGCFPLSAVVSWEGLGLDVK